VWIFSGTTHFDWSPGLFPQTGPKKVENISTFYYTASNVAGSNDQSEPKFSTDGEWAYFVLVWSGLIRCLFSGVEISLNSAYIDQWLWYFVVVGQILGQSRTQNPMQIWWVWPYDVATTSICSPDTLYDLNLNAWYT
jgi:hypothetical protein